MFSKFLLLAGILTSSFIPFAWANTQSSSLVGLTDASLLNRIQSDFSQQPALQALKDFSAVVYDRKGGRNWGTGYLPELTKTWQNLRALACPKLSKLCSLPETISDNSSKNLVIGAFDDPALIDELNELPRSGPFHYTVDDAFYPDFGAVTPFDLIVSAQATRTNYPSLKLWNMSKTNVTETDHEYVVIGDQNTYSQDYKKSPSNAFFGLDGDQGYFLNLDLIKAEAEKFGAYWKTKAELASAPDSQPDWEQEFLLMLEEKHAADFASTYQSLLSELSSSRSQDAAQTRSQFLAFRSKGEYPLEVYQHVAYAMFVDLIRTQAQYYLLADDQRIGLAPPLGAWESFLALQAGNHPTLALYSAFAEIIGSQDTILSQYITPSVAPAILIDDLEAILGTGDYSGQPDLFSRMKYALLSSDLISSDDVKKIPALAKLLTGPSGEPKNLLELDSATQKRALQLYLYDDKGQIRPAAFLEMSANLIFRIQAGDAAELAQRIHQFRAPSLFGNLQ